MPMKLSFLKMINVSCTCSCIMVVTSDGDGVAHPILDGMARVARISVIPSVAVPYVNVCVCVPPRIYMCGTYRVVSALLD